MNYQLLLSLFIPYLIFSQNLSDKELYIYFDQTVSLKNTPLSNGILPKEKFTTINGNHHYFKKNDFLSGHVSYNDQLFFDVLIKYDLADDNIIVNILGNSSDLSITLKKNLVKKFTIENNRFVNKPNYGYIEILIEKKPINLYKKYLVHSQEKSHENFFHTNFKEKHKYLLEYNNKYIYVKKKKDLIKTFPKNKKLISNFYHSNKNLSKKNFDLFLIKLINLLNNNLVINNS